uniref:GLUG motif-containing protein n=1 Tax=Clostridium sp. NkU-1 TaxID=1095009 RepID=UPI0006D17F6B
MNKRRIISFLMACVLCTSFVTPIFAAEQEHIVYIDSTEDFLEFARNCTSDTWSQGKEFRLTRDLNLSGTNFVSIPTFGGLFDGQGHTIQGWSISHNISDIGLFGIVQKGAIVKNLNVTGNIVSTGAQDVLGGIAGTNYGTIYDCSFSGTVKGNSTVGGIVGNNEASGIITGCRASGIISGTHFTGGIVGLNSGSILNCTNDCAVNTDYVEPSVSIKDIEIDLERLNSTENAPAYTDTGGICGYSTGSIDSCTNNGNVGYPHVGYNVGGISGRQSGYMSGCVNNGIINGRKDVGGIVGQMAPDIRLKFSETGIQKLETELNTLHRLLEKTLTDADASSNAVSAELTTASGYLDTARDSAGSMNNQVTGFVDRNTSSANDLTSLIRKYTGQLPEIFAELEDAAEDASQSFSDLQEITPQLDALTGISDDAIGDLQRAVSHLRQASTYLNAGVSEIQSAVDILGKDRYTPDLAAEMKQLQIDSAAFTSAVEALAKIVEEATEEYETTGAISPATLDKMLQSLSDATTCASAVVADMDAIMQKIDWNQIEKESQGLQNDIQTAISHLSRAMNYFSDAFDEIDDSLSDLASFLEHLEEANSSLPAIVSQIQSALSKLESASNSLSGAISKLEKWASNLAGEDEITFSGLGEDYTQSSERLNAALTGLSGSLTSLNSTLSASSDTLIGDLRAVNNQFMVVMNLMLDVYKDIGTGEISRENYYEDISDEDIYETREGKVVGCKNSGEADGDVNVGGVAGSMAIEYDLDPEDDISTNGTRSYDFKYQTRAILLECVNLGNVTSKKDCTGGMVGRMDLGMIYACENYGFISSTSGDYVGGIAGQALSTIRKCFVKSFLSGRRYVGGIAGQGKDIYGCYTLVKVRGDSQNVAAIAGEANGTLSANYFVSDDLAGVDRVSLSGKAEPMSYENLLLLEGLPVRFKSLSMVFMADNAVVKTISVQYGESLEKSQVPEVPNKEGYYGQWSRTDYTNLRFDDVVEAIYTRYFTTLASAALRDNGQSVILVDGQFSQNETIKVTQGDVSDVPLDDINEYWLISMPDDGAAQHTIRYQPLNGNPKKTTIYLYTDGQWKKVDTESMGSYLLFPVDGTEVQLAMESPEQSNMLLITFGAVAVLLVFTLVSAHRLKSKKSNGVKANEPREVTDDDE